MLAQALDLSLSIGDGGYRLPHRQLVFRLRPTLQSPTSWFHLAPVWCVPVDGRVHPAGESTMARPDTLAGRFDSQNVLAVRCKRQGDLVRMML